MSTGILNYSYSDIYPWFYIYDLVLEYHSELTVAYFECVFGSVYREAAQRV